jgi:hypothetical protein
MRRGDTPQRVLTYCPVTGKVVATHAVMSARELARTHSELSFWCSACSRPHHRDPSRLWREGDAWPPEPADCVLERASAGLEEPRRAGEGAGLGPPVRAISRAPDV